MAGRRRRGPGRRPRVWRRSPRDRRPARQRASLHTAGNRHADHAGQRAERLGHRPGHRGRRRAGRGSDLDDRRLAEARPGRAAPGANPRLARSARRPGQSGLKRAAADLARPPATAPIAQHAHGADRPAKSEPWPAGPAADGLPMGRYALNSSSENRGPCGPQKPRIRIYYVILNTYYEVLCFGLSVAARRRPSRAGFALGRKPFCTHIASSATGMNQFGVFYGPRMVHGSPRAERDYCWEVGRGAA